MRILSLEFWNSKKVQRIVLFCFVLIIIGVLWDSKRVEIHIKHHHKIGLAKVYKVELEGRWHHQTVYYVMKEASTGIEYTWCHSFDELPYGVFLKLANKTFPIIYDPKDFSYNCLLLNRSDFYKYGLSYPDSLLWLEQ